MNREIIEAINPIATQHDWSFTYGNSTHRSRPAAAAAQARSGPSRMTERPLSWHRLGPRNMSLVAKRFGHVEVAIPGVRVRCGIVLSPF